MRKRGKTSSVRKTVLVSGPVAPLKPTERENASLSSFFSYSIGGQVMILLSMDEWIDELRYVEEYTAWWIYPPPFPLCFSISCLPLAFVSF